MPQIFFIMSCSISWHRPLCHSLVQVFFIRLWLQFHQRFIICYLCIMQYTLKKSLGRHFLKDENISRKIVSELTKHSYTQLLEIGPGAGALTKFLLPSENIEFKAVEL